MNRNNRALIEELEPRVLLSGTPTPDAGTTPAIDAGSAENSAVQNQQIITEVAFIDQSIDHYEDFIKNIASNIEIIFIEENQNGLELISNYLEDKSNISAIHILSHGNNGSITLGNSELSSDNIDLHANSLQSWSTSLALGADILIYGCNVGQNTQFVDAIANLTGADIAASDDLSGSAELGGNAELEIENGDIRVNLDAFLARQPVAD